jgi:hypothetical protein
MIRPHINLAFPVILGIARALEVGTESGPRPGKRAVVWLDNGDVAGNLTTLRAVGGIGLRRMSIMTRGPTGRLGCFGLIGICLTQGLITDIRSKLHAFKLNIFDSRVGFSPGFRKI